jgi:hypothetical protein
MGLDLWQSVWPFPGPARTARGFAWPSVARVPGLEDLGLVQL